MENKRNNEEKVREREILVGCDECGRGSLAGPVVSGAVIFPSGREWNELRDSKKLTDKRRREFNAQLLPNVEWAIGLSHCGIIDEEGIKQATIESMVNAVLCLIANKYDDNDIIVKIDGIDTLPPLEIGEEIYQEAIIKGDEKIKEISAASIIAKVYRDNYMIALHESHPQYNWKNNKGYGTKEHIKAIQKYGFSEYHRRSFCKKYV